ASGRVKAPIVIGRDHLDSGSVASPYRETEAMRDGSVAIADWPLLNALLSTASGASWVSLHHGGGVGSGPSVPTGREVGVRPPIHPGRGGGRARPRRGGAKARAGPNNRPGYRGPPPRRRRVPGG